MKMIAGPEMLGVWVQEAWKIGEVKGEGVKSAFQTKGLITWAGLACFSEISAP